MISVNRATCCYCGTCVATCPQSLIELIDAYLEIRCESPHCGICEGICPVGALEVRNEG